MTDGETPRSRSLRSRSRTGRGFGYIPDLADHRDRYMTFAVAHLPASVDLRGKMPPVYDQGELGSCTGNAIAAALQYERMRQSCPGAEKVPSRLFIYYNEREMEGSVAEDSGAMIRDGIKSVVALGACFEDDWSYDVARFAERPPQKAYDDAALNQVVKYARLRQQLSAMKSCLAKGFPFVVGFSVYESFDSAEVARTGAVPMPAREEAMLGGHAVLTVGYDDGKRRFTVRNSWGPDWGDGGYFTVPYDYWSDNDLASDIWNVQVVEQ